MVVAGVLVLSSVGAATSVWDSGPDIEYGASGCPVEPFEGLGGAGDFLLSGSSMTRELVRGGAEYALLCRQVVSREFAWEEPLRVTRGVGELQRAMERLPRVRDLGMTTSMACSATNLVLHYPNGERTVMSFECNRDEVGTHRRIRRGAASLTREFARLWRAENAVEDPSRIESAACLPSVSSRPDPLPHPAPKMVRGDQGGRGKELRLPSPLAVVKACRYTADGSGRLVLREQGETRSGLEALRSAVNTVKPKRFRPPCGGAGGRKSTAVDTLHLTDDTGRSDHLYITRKPCEADKSYLTGISYVDPGIASVLSDLLDRPGRQQS